MEPIPGDDCHCSETQTEQNDTEDSCDHCGATLEWTLDIDGVQRLECPHCE